MDLQRQEPVSVLKLHGSHCMLHLHKCDTVLSLRYLLPRCGGGHAEYDSWRLTRLASGLGGVAVSKRGLHLLTLNQCSQKSRNLTDERWWESNALIYFPETVTSAIKEASGRGEGT